MMAGIVARRHVHHHKGQGTMNMLIVTLVDGGGIERFPIHRVSIDPEVIVVSEFMGGSDDGRVVALLDPETMTGTELVGALITAIEGEPAPEST